jgi:hypothetical protein
MALNVNLSDWYAGEDRVFRFTIYDASGAVVDITGWALQFDVRAAPTSGSALASVTTAGGGIALTDPTNGVCDVTIARGTSSGALLPSGNSATYYYGLSRTNSGFWTVLAYGTAVLTRAGVQ